MKASNEQFIDFCYHSHFHFWAEVIKQIGFCCSYSGKFLISSWLNRHLLTDAYIWVDTPLVDV
jgi:hypothetical protein